MVEAKVKHKSLSNAAEHDVNGISFKFPAKLASILLRFAVQVLFSAESLHHINSFHPKMVRVGSDHVKRLIKSDFNFLSIFIGHQYDHWSKERLVVAKMDFPHVG